MYTNRIYYEYCWKQERENIKKTRKYCHSAVSAQFFASLFPDAAITTERSNVGNDNEILGFISWQQA